MRKSLLFTALLLLFLAGSMAQPKPGDFPAVKKAAEQNNAEAQRALGYMYYNGIGTEKNTQEAIRWLTASANNQNAMALWDLAWLFYADTSGAKNLQNAAYCFSKLAEAGHADSQVQLGIMNEKGEGIPINRKTAEKCYRSAAAQGHPEGQFRLGLLLDPSNRAMAKGEKIESVEWYQKAAAQGHPQAQINLGRLYLSGAGGMSVDAPAAEKLFRELANKGYVEAQRRLASLYATGATGVAKDPATAAQWYQKAADQGDMSSQLALAKMYLEGNGIAKNVDTALVWYRKAGDQGSGVALMALAEIYRDGKVVSKDPAVAFDWYRKAVDAGVPEAMYRVGVGMFNGEGFPKDEKGGLTYVEKAAQKGFLFAQQELIALYNGDEYPMWLQEDMDNAVKYGLLKWKDTKYKDESKAEPFEFLAADNGDDDAMVAVGYMCLRGEGAPHSAKQAEEWFASAALRGNVLAQSALADMYGTSEYGVYDPNECLKWYIIAGKYGFDFGTKMAESLKKDWPKDEVEVVERRAAEWMSQPYVSKPQKRWLIFRTSLY